MKSTDVAIIGAGPYGLSVSAHLRRRGVAHAIFGKPLETWRERMPAGMGLKSDPFASNLSDPDQAHTLEAYRRERGEPYGATNWIVPLETFIDYGRWFQARAVPDLDQREVTHLETADAGFVLTLSDGEQLAAKRVVAAIGIRDFAYVPPFLAQAPGELVSHSSMVPDPKRFAGKDVTVLGSGASAIDLTALLNEAGASARLVARAPGLSFHAGDQALRGWLAKLRRPTSGVGPGWKNLFVTEAPAAFAGLPESVRISMVKQMLGPAAGRGMRDRIEGKVSVLAGASISAVDRRGDRLVLSLMTPAGAESVEADHLIAATGYRPDVSRLGMLSPALRQRIAVVEQAPRLRTDFQSSVPGLFFVGPASAYRLGPGQRFVYGAAFAAKTVVRALS